MMGRISFCTLTTIFLLVGTLGSAQQVSTITNPTLELRDNKIHIIYDILNSDSTETYQVQLEITDSSGRVIDAHTLSGDIGDRVNGGEDKCIVWSFQTDNIYIDGDLYIQIYAISDRKQFSRSSLILQSLAFPGLGLSRLTGKPHWLRGVAGYGCLAGSIALNRMAYSTYEDYQDPESASEAASLLDKATQQDQISEVLAFVAAGIWITDIVWTLMGTSGMKNSDSLSEREGFSIGAGYDSRAQLPLLSFKYRFGK